MKTTITILSLETYRIVTRANYHLKATGKQVEVPNYWYSLVENTIIAYNHESRASHTHKSLK